MLIINISMPQICIQFNRVFSWRSGQRVRLLSVASLDRISLRWNVFTTLGPAYVDRRSECSAATPSTCCNTIACTTYSLKRYKISD